VGDPPSVASKIFRQGEQGFSCHDDCKIGPYTLPVKPFEPVLGAAPANLTEALDFLFSFSYLRNEPLSGV
jgi:hypothetical protein